MPALTPQVAALWKHPFFGGGGVYVGTGGLDLFQIDLDGTITTTLGVSVSGASTCTMKLPKVVRVVPAGNLGAVVLELTPTLTLDVTGKIAVNTSVTLRCGAEYRWTKANGGSTVSYCRAAHQPLQVTAANADATLTGNLAARVTLNELVGFDGNITASVHAGLHPLAQPLAQLDAKATYDLSACLACIWKGSPARAPILSGTWFQKVLATYDTPPAPAPASPPAITTTTLPEEPSQSRTRPR